MCSECDSVQLNTISEAGLYQYKEYKRGMAKHDYIIESALYCMIILDC